MLEPALTVALKAALAPSRWQIMLGSWYSVPSSKPRSVAGPVITYLASCNGDCTTVDKTTLEFFKIEEEGLID
jgi:hypothetical protein